MVSLGICLGNIFRTICGRWFGCVIFLGFLSKIRSNLQKKTTIAVKLSKDEIEANILKYNYKFFNYKPIYVSKSIKYNYLINLNLIILYSLFIVMDNHILLSAYIYLLFAGRLL